MKKMFLFGAVLAVALAGSAADVTVSKPYFRWLFNGFGFQNSEANFLRIMPADFRDQRVLKTFRELSPCFARVYTGFVDETKADLDNFADYYDLTFRGAGTTLYAVPCGMPALPETIDADDYAEKVAQNLEYLIRERNCRKIRYYCLSNELMAGDRWCHFVNGEKRELFKKFYAALFYAFRRHGLDIRLLASDESDNNPPTRSFQFLDWIKANMNDFVGVYCTHWYVHPMCYKDKSPADLWTVYNDYFSNQVQFAQNAGCKRYILGEYGFQTAWPKRGVMQDDTSYHLRRPEIRAESVLSKCEIGLAAMNQGAVACADWSFVDYPDPFVIEDGDTPLEQAWYRAGRHGYRMDGKYNKWGKFRWHQYDHDYSAYEELYATGWMVKLFRKNATVLAVTSADPFVRCGATINTDRSVSIMLVNRGVAKTVSIASEAAITKPMRRIVYDSANVPVNAFNDLQNWSGTVKADGKGELSVELPAKSIVFLTSDYEDAMPEKIGGVACSKGMLSWQAAKSENHRYYRVYRGGRQIASTVATKLAVSAEGPSDFVVTSVDRWQNESVR